MQAKFRYRVKGIAVLLLALYLAALAYVCFFSETYGRDYVSDEYRYNLHPFKEIMRFFIYRDVVGAKAFLLNLFGNIFVFSPFGFIVPVAVSKCRSLFKMVQLTFALSLMIETIQLVLRVGTFDVDDLILNTLGGVLGYALFELVRKVKGV